MIDYLEEILHQVEEELELGEDALQVDGGQLVRVGTSERSAEESSSGEVPLAEEREETQGEQWRGAVGSPLLSAETAPLDLLSDTQRLVDDVSASPVEERRQGLAVEATSGGYPRQVMAEAVGGAIGGVMDGWSAGANERVGYVPSDDLGVVDGGASTASGSYLPTGVVGEGLSSATGGTASAIYGQMTSRHWSVELLQRENSTTTTRVVEQMVPVETGLQPTTFDRYAQRDARRYDSGFTLY